MQEYEFSLTRIFSYKHRIYDSVLIQENPGQKKPVFLHFLRYVGRKFSEQTKGRPFCIWSIVSVADIHCTKNDIFH